MLMTTGFLRQSSNMGAISGRPKGPVAGYLEVETSADVQACGPLADVIGRETHCRINAPAFAQVEDVLRVRR